jgi:hypothetical protein
MKKWLQKIFRHRHDTRYEWGEFVWHPHPKRWSLSLKFTDAYSNEKDMLIIEPLFCSVYIHLSTEMCRSKNGHDGREKNFGFYIYPQLWKIQTVVFCFGTKQKHFEMPWGWKWHSTEILDHKFNPVYYEDTYTNKHVSFNHRYEAEDYLKNLYSEIYEYKYTLKNGTVQERIAKVAVERRVWKMRWFPFVKMKRTTISVVFDEEVGGCTGCGYDILPGETPEQTLRRMEKERRFDR